MTRLSCRRFQTGGSGVRPPRPSPSPEPQRRSDRPAQPSARPSAGTAAAGSALAARMPSTALRWIKAPALGGRQGCCRRAAGEAPGRREWLLRTSWSRSISTGPHPTASGSPPASRSASRRRSPGRRPARCRHRITYATSARSTTPSRNSRRRPAPHSLGHGNCSTAPSTRRCAATGARPWPARSPISSSRRGRPTSSWWDAAVPRTSRPVPSAFRPAPS